MKSYTYLLVMLLLLSCNHVYKEYDKASFPVYIWKSGQEIAFSPNIEDIEQTYTLTVAIRHVYGIPASEIGISIRSIAPSGKETINTYNLEIKNSSNEYAGSCAGDLCDLEKMVNENLKFDEPGEHKFIITHNIRGKNIPGIMEVGMIIDKKY